jgi:ABC-type amino acid transport substrate-binding protein
MKIAAALAAAIFSLAATASDFDKGREQFQRTCAQCHGHNMVNSGTTVYDLRRFPLDQPSRFYGSVAGGKGNMPAFGNALDGEQIRWLWAYVRARGEPPTPLKVCVAEDNPPLSFKEKKALRGFDVLVSKAIAEAAGRPLELVPFETELEMDKTLATEVNALLSSGACELASGYALFESDLGAPGRPTARVPDYPGAPPRRQRPFVPLGRIAATKPYYAAAMGVVTRDPALKVEFLADLQERKLGAVSGTMAGSALVLYRGGLLVKNIVTLTQQEDLLAELEQGRFDATLTPLGRYDAYRLRHPETKLVRAKYLHPLRINLGFVGLESNPDIVGIASREIERAVANGDLAKWAADSGVTWIAPQPPDVQGAFTMGSLRAE